MFRQTVGIGVQCVFTKVYEQIAAHVADHENHQSQAGQRHDILGTDRREHQPRQTIHPDPFDDRGGRPAQTLRRPSLFFIDVPSAGARGESGNSRQQDLRGFRCTKKAHLLAALLYRFAYPLLALRAGRCCSASPTPSRDCTTPTKTSISCTDWRRADWDFSRTIGWQTPPIPHRSLAPSLPSPTDTCMRLFSTFITSSFSVFISMPFWASTSISAALVLRLEHAWVSLPRWCFCIPPCCAGPRLSCSASITPGTSRPASPINTSSAPDYNPRCSVSCSSFRSALSCMIGLLWP